MGEHPIKYARFFLNEEALQMFAAEFAVHVGHHAIILLHGSLGAGKTTFTRGFLRGLGYQDVVKSPTYSIVEPYEFLDYHVYHFDFYRVTDPHELELIGLKDYVNHNAICLMEWPELVENVLPPADVSCQFDIQQEGRQLTLKALSPHGMSILKKIGKDKH